MLAIVQWFVLLPIVFSIIGWVLRIIYGNYLGKPARLEKLDTEWLDLEKEWRAANYRGDTVNMAVYELRLRANLTKRKALRS